MMTINLLINKENWGSVNIRLRRDSAWGRSVATIPQIIDLVSDRLTPIVTRPSDDPPLAGATRSAADPVLAAIDAQRFAEFELLHDAEEKILFCYFNFANRPCFTEAVLREAQAVQKFVRSLFGDHTDTEPPLRYMVLGSRVPGVW